MMEIFTAISTWHWPMLAAFLAGGSFLVGTASLLIVANTQVIRPWLRRRKLKRPFAAYFSITSLRRFPLEYVVQDDQDHEVKELVVPAHSVPPHPRPFPLLEFALPGFGRSIQSARTAMHGSIYLLPVARAAAATSTTPVVFTIGLDPVVNFDPMQMADGIGPTDDPVMRFRSSSYAMSHSRRQTEV
jgi:hypothetical protein